MSRKNLSHYAKSERGASAVELAFSLFLLTIPILNVVDLAFYAFNWMQTENAAQMGAQAAFSNCNSATDFPAATNCYGAYNSADNMTFYDVVNMGVQETALNNTVAITGNVLADGYYCAGTSSNLVLVGNLGYAYPDSGVLDSAYNSSDTAPSAGGAANCTGYADSTAAPGEYITVNVTHTYTSIFPGMSVVALLPSVMTATAYARIH